MDPISLSIQAIGLGAQIFGGMGQASAAHQISQASQDKAQREGQINDLREQQTVLEAHRMQLQNVRNLQRARALATNSATTQGAQFGSGLQGGLADVQSQGLFNMQGVNQALQTSESIAGQNKYISQDNSQIASLQGQAATDQGIASIGGALLKAGPAIGSFSQGFGSLFGGSRGNYSGTPGASNTGGLY